MNRGIKYFFYGGILMILLLQIPQPERSNPPVTGDLQVSTEVQTILRKACYDCHSNETNWPWYSYINPIAWQVSHDVVEGRKHLNFSEWSSYEARKQYHVKGEIVDVLKEDEMPLQIYLIMHGEAELTQHEKQLIYTWADK
ncbi:heme-binding domain-containing protein [bacterium]|nr:heme-binding domain-containing protein [bacterium]